MKTGAAQDPRRSGAGYRSSLPRPEPAVGCTATVPYAGKPLAVAGSPDLDLHVWGGKDARAARLGPLRLGGRRDRLARFEGHRGGLVAVRVRVVGPDDRPLPHAVVYLFPEGGPGFAHEGLGAALDDTRACLDALRTARRRPIDGDLAPAGVRKTAVEGVAVFDGVTPGEARVVVVAGGVAQRVAPTVDVPAEGPERVVTARCVDLAAHVGVLRIRLVDPLGGPFQGRVDWNVADPKGGFADHGTTTAREDGLVVYAPPLGGLVVTVTTGERGGLGGRVADVTTALGQPTAVLVRLEPPPGPGGK